MDISIFEIDLSKMEVKGTTTFDGVGTALKITGRATKDYVNINSGFVNWRNTLDNVKSHTALTDGKVDYNSGNYHIYRDNDVKEAVFESHDIKGPVVNKELERGIFKAKNNIEINVLNNIMLQVMSLMRREFYIMRVVI